MTVFKGFMLIARKNYVMIVLYLVIFLTIALVTDRMLGDTETEGFAQTRLDIAVIDRDGGKLARGLTDYLANFHNIKDIPDDESSVRDSLFYRNIYYLVTIPGDFEEKCLYGDELLPVTKVPGSTSGYYVDQQIRSFLNGARVLISGGFSVREAADMLVRESEHETPVRILGEEQKEWHTPNHAFMFRYMPYIIIAVLAYTLSGIMIAFDRPDVKRRIQCSAVSDRSINLQLLGGHILIGLAVWLICLLMPVCVYRGQFLSDPHLPWYMANSFAVTVAALSLAFLIGTFVHREELVSAVVNVVALGMSFLCGVFVSLDIIGGAVRTIARFLPVYWYEVGNDILSGSATLSEENLATLYTCLGMQLLFAAAFTGTALVFRRSRASES